MLLIAENHEAPDPSDGVSIPSGAYFVSVSGMGVTGGCRLEIRLRDDLPWHRLHDFKHTALIRLDVPEGEVRIKPAGEDNKITATISPLTTHVAQVKIAESKSWFGWFK